MPYIQELETDNSYIQNPFKENELEDLKNSESIHHTIMDLEENIIFLLRGLRNSNQYDSKQVAKLHLLNTHRKYSDSFKKQGGFQLIPLFGSIIAIVGGIAGIAAGDTEMGKKIADITTSISKGSEFATQGIDAFYIKSLQKDLDYQVTYLQQCLQELNKQGSQISEKERQIRETLTDSFRKMSQLIQQINKG